MAKPIPKIGSRRNGRINSRKSARKIPKGIIHVQASFNNTIVIVTDVRGRVVSWSSSGTCGFRGTKRGTPFAAQTAVGNAIRTVLEQGMRRAEVMIKGLVSEEMQHFGLFEKRYIVKFCTRRKTLCPITAVGLLKKACVEIRIEDISREINDSKI